MTTYFAQNSSVNIDSAEQWNDAADGSGTDLVWPPDPTDILVANGKTSITINVDTTVVRVTNANTDGGTAGGQFLLGNGIILTANVVSGTSTCVFATLNSGQTATVTGNVTAGTSSNARGIDFSGDGTLTVNGSIISSSGSNSHGVSVTTGVLNANGNVTGATGRGISITSSGHAIVTGNVLGGGGSFGHGIVITGTNGKATITGDVTAATGFGLQASGSSCIVTINGDCYASATRTGVELFVDSGVLILNGSQYASAAGFPGVCCSGKFLIHASDSLIHAYSVNNAGSAGDERELTTGGGGTFPEVDDVRDGTVYGATDELTGTLTLPSVLDVRDGEQYGGNGTELTGTLTSPSEDDVRLNEQYGSAGTEFTGNLTLPPEEDVEEGVQYGTDGTEFTGTFVPTTPTGSSNSISVGVNVWVNPNNNIKTGVKVASGPFSFNRIIEEQKELPNSSGVDQEIKRFNDTKYYGR